MTLVSTSDVLERATQTIDNAIRLEALIADASAAVRSYTGQQFTQASSTDRVKVRRGVVRLPQRPVSAVSAVVDLAGNPVLFTWLGDDTVRVASNTIDAWAWEPWSSPIQVVDVTYTHGYAETPADVVAVVCQMVLRAAGAPAEDSGTTQETIDNYSYSIGTAGASGPVGMLADERAVLDRYRLVGGRTLVGGW